MRSFRQRGDALSLHERTMALKQRQRDADELALKEGRLTAQEINRKNSAFSPEFIRSLKLDVTRTGWAK